MRSKTNQTVLALLLVIAIDSMGYGFIFPVLTPIFLHGHNALVPAGLTAAEQWFVYGVIVALYPLFMLFGAPILGDLSDRIGRKKVLLICLLGTMAGYLIAGIGISLNRLSLLILGRIIDGITAGTLSMAQAAIADVSSNSKNQTRYMGWMMAAIAGGQVLGPAIAGFFSDQHISSHFSNSWPFYIGALLSAFNLVWLLFAFHETYLPATKSNFSITQSLRSFTQAFNGSALLKVTLIFLFMQFSWSLFSQGAPAYLGQHYNYTNLLLGVFSAALGILIAIGGSGITPVLARHVSTQHGALIGLLAMALSTMAICSWQAAWFFWVATAFNACGAAIAFSFIIVLFSQCVDETRQGWVMGLSGAVIAIAWTATALLAGILIHYGSVIPLVFTSLFGFIAVLLMSTQRSSRHS